MLVLPRLSEKLTEEENESNAVEDQDVGDMSDTSVAEELHLLFRRAHEEETGGIEKLLYRSVSWGNLSKSNMEMNIRMAEGIGSCLGPFHPD